LNASHPPFAAKSHSFTIFDVAAKGGSAFSCGEAARGGASAEGGIASSCDEYTSSTAVGVAAEGGSSSSCGEAARCSASAKGGIAVCHFRLIFDVSVSREVAYSFLISLQAPIPFVPISSYVSCTLRALISHL
jgi:hypothetical protein